MYSPQVTTFTSYDFFLSGQQLPRKIIKQCDSELIGRIVQRHNILTCEQKDASSILNLPE